MLRFLILNTDYPQFLRWLYAQHRGLEGRTYDEQMRARVDSLFGVADFYSSNLRKLGHEAWDIHVNNQPMQKAWATEHGVHVEEPSRVPEQWRRGWQRARRLMAQTPLRHLRPFFGPVFRSPDSQQSWIYKVLAAQIKQYQPDVILNQSMPNITPRFLREVRAHARLVVGQHAATCLSQTEDYGCYHLVISSFPPTIEYFRRKGVRAELHRLGFEPKVLSRLGSKRTVFDATFVGSLFAVHSSRVALLEGVCARLPQVKVWGQGITCLPVTSPIRRSYMGQAWGLEMFEILSRSKITLNHHGDVGPYANNMRLFEATGVGTLLVTDCKTNLHEMFEPGKEVIAYRTPQECAELVQYYLEHEDERKAVARAGQQRTLRDHTYHQRMQELVSNVEGHLYHPEAGTRRVFG